MSIRARLRSKAIRDKLCLQAYDIIKEQDAQIAEFKRILEGVSQDAIDGGWTAKGLMQYAAELQAKVNAISFQTGEEW